MIRYEDKAQKWGDVYYLKDDPEQVEYSLVGVLLQPGKPKLQLSHKGDVCEVYEFETTRQPDMVKKLTGGVDDEDD